MKKCRAVCLIVHGDSSGNPEDLVNIIPYLPRGAAATEAGGECEQAVKECRILNSTPMDSVVEGEAEQLAGWISLVVRSTVLLCGC